MKRHSRACARAGALGMLAATLAACGAPAPVPVTLNLRGVVGQQDFVCGQSYSGVGTPPSSMTPIAFRFYLSNLRLIDGGGSEFPITLTEDGVWQHQGVALISLETLAQDPGLCGQGNGNLPVNQTIKGQATQATYTGLRFDLGLPFSVDHQDASVAVSPLNVSSMFWSWQGGYQFLRVDANSVGQPDGFNIHIGSTDCQVTPPQTVTSCVHQNVASVELSPFNPQSQVMVADLADLVSGFNVDVNAAGTPAGCMADASDPDCLPIFHNLGLPFNTESSAPSPQKFFRVQ